MNYWLGWLFLVVWIPSFAQQNEGNKGQPLTIANIVIAGNEITKEYIILREFTFSPGDTLSESRLIEELSRTRKNIWNTQLFNFVELEYASDGGKTEVIVQVQEQWYLWPVPIFENADRNFNTWWQNKDFGRLNYGINVRKYNFRGRNETVFLNLQWGFERLISGSYELPFIDRKKRKGLKFKAGYATYQEVNYGSAENRRLFLESSTEPLRTNIYAGADYIYRGGLYIKHTAGFTYHNHSIGDSLLTVTRDYLPQSVTDLRYFSFNYIFRFDKRDNINYPLTGNLFQVFTTYRNNAMFSNDAEVDLWEIDLTYNHHVQLHKRWYAGASIKGKSTVRGRPPYLIQQGLGYGTTLRGYELYVMDAQDFIAYRSHLKFELVPTQVKNWPLIKDEKFKKFFYALYLNLNIDAGYASDELYAQQNPLSNEWLFGYGLGIDLVSYYDIVLRTEYSRNIEGEDGVYLHFKKAF